MYQLCKQLNLQKSEKKVSSKQLRVIQKSEKKVSSTKQLRVNNTPRKRSKNKKVSMMSMVSITCLMETFTIPMAITSTKMDLTNMVAITKDCTTNQVLATRQNTIRDTKRFTVPRMRVPMKKTNITLKITSPRARAKRTNMKN